jgi:hypothetical protein
MKGWGIETSSIVCVNCRNRDYSGDHRNLYDDELRKEWL